MQPCPVPQVLGSSSGFPAGDHLLSDLLILQVVPGPCPASFRAHRIKSSTASAAGTSTQSTLPFFLVDGRGGTRPKRRWGSSHPLSESAA